MEKFYTYTHSINGVVFYVGAALGNPERAYETGNNRRPDKWWEYVNSNNGNYDIEIVEVFDSRSEACAAEAKLIHFYHDIGQAQASREDYRGEKNPMYNTKAPNSREIIVYKNNKLFGEYETIQSFVDEIGINENSNRLNNYIRTAVHRMLTGYEYTRGRWKGWKVYYKQ